MIREEQLMKTKLNQIVNIIMISFICQFIGSGFYKYWHFRKYPAFHAVQSTPWYISILIHGLFTLVILTICIIIKVILKKRH